MSRIDLVVMSVLAVLPDIVHDDVGVARPGLVRVVPEGIRDSEVERHVRSRTFGNFATPSHGYGDLESAVRQRDIDFLAVGHHEVGARHVDSNVIVVFSRNGIGSQDPCLSALKLHEVEMMWVVAGDEHPLPVLVTRVHGIDRYPTLSDLRHGVVVDLDRELTVAG